MRGTLTKRGNIRTTVYRQLIKNDRPINKRHAGRAVEFDIDVADAVLVGRNVRFVKDSERVTTLPGADDFEKWDE